jgi:hypothetical protein
MQCCVAFLLFSSKRQYLWARRAQVLMESRQTFIRVYDNRKIRVILRAIIEKDEKYPEYEELRLKAIQSAAQNTSYASL